MRSRAPGFGEFHSRPHGPKNQEGTPFCLRSSALTPGKGWVLEVSLYLPGPQFLPVKCPFVCPRWLPSRGEQGRKGLEKVTQLWN